MANVGHDGLGHFYGESLVDVQTDKEIFFNNISEKSDKIEPENINGATDYGISILKSPDKSDAWSKLGITEDGLEGKEGPRGPQGPEGPMGPVGPAGLTWRHQWNETTTYVADDAVGYAGASWFALKESVNKIPNEEDSEYWALLASQGARGPQGPEGPPGSNGKDAVFNVNNLSNDDLVSLNNKLKPLTPRKFWAYRMKAASANNGAKTIKLADMNLNFILTTTSADSVKYELTRADSSLPSTYLVRRFTVYSTTSLEGKVTPNYQSYQFTSTPWLVDDYDYADGRSEWHMKIIDSTNKIFYMVQCQMNIESDGRYLYMEVNKVGSEGYVDV
ncbi:tail fiber protein [Erwinia phage FBB1]|nr:tail fiber protein [Erwinia phage FBB1]